MKLPIYQIDAFASHVFSGNPAAVCPLPDWIDDGLMQSIAAENNLSETAFFVPAGEGFELRWFTPLAEIDLCGHATLAAAAVIYELGLSEGEIAFATNSGQLSVARGAGGLLAMDFPAYPVEPCDPPAELLAGLGIGAAPVLCGGGDFVVVLDQETEVRRLTPDFSLLARLPLRGVSVTAPGDQADFVSRFFAPKLGIDEDPVTGSAHCALAPYWAARLGRRRLQAQQLSRRGGELFCEVKDERVVIAGQAVKYLQGNIFI